MSKIIICKTCGAASIRNKTSGYIGVDYYRKGTIHKWRARVTDNCCVTHHLGYYATELEASKVYDEYIINNELVNKSLNHPIEVQHGK